MKKSINKTKTAAITITVLLMASIALTAIIPVQAQYTNMQSGDGGRLPAGVTPDVRVATYPSLSFRPNPIGVGQTLLVNMWIHPPTANSRRLTGLTVTLTKPDGTKEVIGPMETYRGDGTAWFEYVVNQVGTWKLKFDVPGQYYPAGNYTSGQELGYSSYGRVTSIAKSCYYEPSSTAEQELVVQQEQVRSWPGSPLPTDYWTRPVSSINRDWWPILGNWPSWNYRSQYSYGGAYVLAPKTAHVVWKRRGGQESGLAGGELGQLSFTSSRGTPSLIYLGRAYQTYTKPGVGSVAACYDIRTGEIYYEIPIAAGGVTPTAISSLVSDAIAVEGATGNLGPVIRLLSIGTRLIEIDPYTGAVLQAYVAPGTPGVMNSGTLGPMNVTGMPGVLYNDPYVMSVQNLGGGRGYRLINWTAEKMCKGSTAVGYEDNFTARIISNITWPYSSLSTTTDFNAGVAVNTASITDGATDVTMGTRIWGTSLKTGQVLWNVTTTHVQYSGSTAVADNGKYCFAVRDSYGGMLAAWDLFSGKLAWETDLEYPWGFAGAYAVASAYGLVYRFSYAGVYALDWDTGKIVWRYATPTNPYEMAYADPILGTLHPFNSGAQIADGIMYVANSEHSATQPIARGWKLHAVNATTGEGIWNITGSWGTPGAIADGYLTASDAHTGYMYVFGKGKSATAVTAPDVVVTKGNGVVIRGTVLDLSPAQPGTPCVSKDSMTTQMEYLHMQLPISGVLGNETITGVPVALTAIGSDGKVYDLGTATTNGYSGVFSLAWTPPTEDTYEIIASFGPDDSYGSSMSTTTVSVGPAPETPQTPEQIAPPDYTWTIIGTGIAVIIAVALAALLILRKR